LGFESLLFWGFHLLLLGIIMKKALGLLVLGSFLAISCASTGERSENVLLNSAHDPVFVPEAQEIQIGLQAAQAVGKQYKVSADSGMRAYVNSLGQSLAKAGDRPDLEYSFTLLQDPMVNAFALPGGHVYVTTGILAKLKDESELAAVLGHEIGHVVKQHGLKILQRQVVANLGMNYVLSLLSDDKAALLQAFAQPAESLLFLRNGREAELESDEQGMLIASRAGLDPSAMIRVQEMLMEAGGRADPLFGDLLSDHPASEARISQAKAILPRYQGPTDRGESRYQKEILSRLK
jgi:predicted Zn-dependent protease